jgi:hypothetical protein
MVSFQAVFTGSYTVANAGDAVITRRNHPRVNDEARLNERSQPITTASLTKRTGSRRLGGSSPLRSWRRNGGSATGAAES